MGQKEAKPKRVCTVLTERQIKMLMDMTRLSRDEILQWHAGFLRDCPDGLLNKTQFANSYKQLYPEGKADKFCNLVFDAFDKNGDGTIDFNEFLIATSITLHGNIKEKLELAFDMYDTDRNRVIDQKELEYMLEALMELKGITPDEDLDPKKRARAIMQSMDVDGDCKINKEEFIHGCLRDAHLKSMFIFNSINESYEQQEDTLYDSCDQDVGDYHAANVKRRSKLPRSDSLHSRPEGSSFSNKDSNSKLQRSMRGETACRGWQNKRTLTKSTSNPNSTPQDQKFKRGSLLKQSTQL